MEVASCIKAVVMAASQYQNNTSEANIVNMQRQLDVLITVTGRPNQLKCFDARQMLPTECLTCVADILNDTDTKPVLVHKCLILLNNLAHDSEIRRMLHTIFHFTPILASLVKMSRGSADDPLVCDCLSLLQKITYGQRIPLHESNVEDLINFLIKHIQGPESCLTHPALGLLANLCRNNSSVQSYIKNQEQIRAFYRCLISYLSHENPSLIIFSLSVLTSLCLHDELGEKLYHGKNINKTFQLIFNILINGDAKTSQPYAVDLFSDLVKNSKIQESLLVFDHLSVCLVEVLNLIPASSSDSVVKLLELLVSFCSVANLRRVICGNLMCSPSLQEPGQFGMLAGQPAPHTSHPFFSLLHVARQPVGTHDLAPLMALDFLKEMYEELVFSGLTSEVNTNVDLLLPVITDTLTAPLPSPGAGLRNHCHKLVKAAQILLVLSEDDAVREQVTPSVDATILVKHLEYQYNSNKIAINLTRLPTDPDDWSGAGVDVVLYVLELMCKLTGHVEKIKAVLHQALQDSRFVPFLAHGITSDIRSRVQVSLHLLQSAASLTQFSTIVLGDCIAANNGRRAVEPRPGLAPVFKAPPTSHAFVMSSKENIPVLKPVSKKLTDTQEASIQSLIDKMQMGLDVKDIKPSEMISVYEQKLQCLQTKEHHLQDLLEAKALALSQADRLLVQYRSQRAQSEAELAKMRGLVQEAEQRSEEYREQLNSVMLEREKLQLDQEELLQENRRLVVIEEECKEISAAFSEQSQKLEKTQKSLTALKQEHKSLSEMQEMLQRHNETLKQQHDIATQQLTESEDVRKNVQRQLKEKESKLNELSKAHQKLEENHKIVSSEKNNLEEAIDKLRTELTKAEQNKKHLQHQVTSLELLCQQHEAAIQEKDTLIENQKVEINKHNQIAALIHNLSSGKGVDPKP